LIAGLILGAMVLVQGTPAAASSAGAEVGWTLLAAGTNLLYVPLKVTIAAVGLFTGSFVGLMNGGDDQSAYAIWVPTASGTFVLTPGHFEGTKPFEFWGSDYTDTASLWAHDTDASRIYDAKYAGN
jgi:hypothetical protein